MIQQVYQTDFIDAFSRMNREDNFSHEGLCALFDWFETGDYENTELDVISICFGFTEYKNLEEFQAEYGEEEYKSMDDVQDATSVILVGDEGFIIQIFSPVPLGMAG